jgi:hypothetical protein
MSIFFYDNDPSNKPTEDQNDVITFIQITQKPPPLPQRMGYTPGIQQEVWDPVSSYFLSKCQDCPFLNLERYDKLSGINADHIAELKPNITVPNKVTAVVFDWDRTLTKMEGIWFPNNTESYPKEQGDTTLTYFRKCLSHDSEFTRIMDVLPNDREHMLYMFHDSEGTIDIRPKMIGDMFRMLNKNNIPFFILTKNEAAGENIDLFKQFIQNLIVELSKMDEENPIITCAGIFYNPPEQTKGNFIINTIKSQFISHGGKKTSRGGKKISRRGKKTSRRGKKTSRGGKKTSRNLRRYNTRKYRR